MTAWTTHEVFNLLTTDAALGEALGRVVGAIDTRAMDLAAVLARAFPA